MSDKGSPTRQSLSFDARSPIVTRSKVSESASPSITKQPVSLKDLRKEIDLRKEEDAQTHGTITMEKEEEIKIEV